jgi:acetyl esterase/lipase
MKNETLRLYSEPYENGFMPTMTTYLCDDKVRGAVIVFPGGGYSHYGSSEQTLIAKRFNELGFHAFVVIYSVAPNHYPAPQRDGFRAIKMVRANAARYNVDPGKIAVCGFSAGGHLVGSLGVLHNKMECVCGDEIDSQPQRPDAVIMCYPVVSMAGELANTGSALNLIGSDDAELRDYLSLQKRIDSETSPAMCWITADDGAVDRDNPIVFAREMWRQGLDCELHVFPHGPHGQGLNIGRDDVYQWSGLAATFLRTTCGF